MDIELLRVWFSEERRDLPWRLNPSPYSVWISEVMLQQTQVAVVIPYFNKWMSTFPTIESLAQSDLSSVIKVWEGLGYYSRARNIHAAAQMVVKEYGGKLPSNRELLIKIKGFGSYTAGALLSFAFHKKAPAVDGNVMRVLTRFFYIEEDVTKLRTRTLIEGLVEKLLPEHEPWVVMEALIELGALICTKRPSCHLCPVNEKCRAYNEGAVERLPVKTKPAETTFLHREVALIIFNGQVLIKKVADGQVMAGLYEFPFFETKKEQENILAGQACRLKKFPMISHSFTRYRAKLYPTLWHAKKEIELSGYRWVDLSLLNKLPFSSGHRQLLSYLNKSAIFLPN